MVGGKHGEENFGDHGKGRDRDVIAGADRGEAFVEIGVPADCHAVRRREIADALGHGIRGGRVGWGRGKGQRLIPGSAVT